MEYREVYVEFRADDKEALSSLTSFIDEFAQANEGKRLFSWVRKWDERKRCISEDEMISADIRFTDDVLPFFEQLNEAVRGVRYEGALVRIQDKGEFDKTVRRVSFDGKRFQTSLTFWMEGERNEPTWPYRPRKSILFKGGKAAGGRVDRGGNAFSWSYSPGKTLSIFAEKGSDVIVGFKKEAELPWASFAGEIEEVAFTSEIAAQGLDYLFAGLGKLERVSGFELVASANLKSTRRMFDGCGSMRSIDLSGLGLSSLRDANRMFVGCSKLEAFDATPFRGAKIKDASGMFMSCKSLRHIDLSSMDFSETESASYMLRWCVGLESVVLPTRDPSSSIRVNGMFEGCEKLKSVLPDGWTSDEAADATTSDDTGAGFVSFSEPHRYDAEITVDGIVMCRQDRHARVAVAGVSYRNIDFSLLKAGSLVLEREPKNPYDRDAVKVVSCEAGHIGYLPKRGKLKDAVNECIKAKDSWPWLGLLLPMSPRDP